MFRDLGYRGLDEYVREQLGMAPSKARALLRLERLALVSRAFRRAWRQGQVSWTQAQVLAPLLVLEHALPWQAAWILRAQQVTVRRLGDDVGWAIASGQLDPAALPALPAELSPASLSLAGLPAVGLSPAGLQLCARPKGSEATARFFFTAPRDVARLFRAVLATVQRRIERAHGRPSNENEAFHAMLEHAIETWGQRRQQSGRLRTKHAVFARDGWRCTVPGCTAYRNLHAHHLEFRSAGGSDDPSNCITLCAFHHLRGIHTGLIRGRGGLIRCRGRAPEGLRFALGLRPGLPPLMTYTSGDVAVAG